LKNLTANSATLIARKEKLGENRTFHNFIVYTDRLNYCSALMNNVIYSMSVEKLMGIEIPERCVWIRMICCELARVMDHLVCIGINAVDLGAFSFFLYGFISAKKLIPWSKSFAVLVLRRHTRASAA